MKKLLLTLGICLCTVGMAAGQIISQYVETNSGTTPKGIEIWNNTGSTIDFSVDNLLIQKGTNGGTPSNDATVSTGTLASGAVMVIGTSDMGTYLTNNNLSGVTFVDESFTFNGDDALVVILGSDTTDIFGVPGTDPGSSWSGNGVDTRNQNIQLIPGLNTGVTTVANAWSDPSTRFETENSNPTGTNGLNGFGVSPLELSITGDAGWRMLSFPVEDGSADDISDDTAIQGVAGGDNTGAASNFQTYDNSGAFETPTNVSTAIGDGYGFITYFYNNTTAGSSELPVKLDISGSEPSSNVSVTLNTSTTESSSYFTMVGNPFSSNYDLNSITVTGGSIQNNVAFWNDGTSSYSAQDRTGPYIVAPWQGFWVESTDAATSITIPTSGKSTSGASGRFFGKENADRGDLNFTLTSENTYDEAIRLSIRPNATQGFDIDDASKFTPLTSPFATMAFVGQLNNEDKLQSVFSLPTVLEEEIIIPMDLSVYNASGEFTFAWNNMETMPEGWDFELVDYETGETVLLREESSYTFTAEEAASKENRTVLHVASTMESTEDSPRFGLKVVPSTSVSNEPTDTPITFGLEQNYPNPFNPSTTIKYSVGEAGPVSITVYNVMGQKVAELLNTTRSAGEYQVTWNADNQASGIYYYRLTAPGQVITRQMTLIK